MFETSENGIELIKQMEGFRGAAYRCPAGKLTIGYGSTVGVKPGMIVTEQQAEMMLKQHLKSDEMRLNSLGLHINQNQFDALMSFIYNVGWANFRRSTLLKYVKAAPNSPMIADEFRKWRFANGRALPGLIKRREAELKLYTS
jgi:lysozyme